MHTWCKTPVFGTAATPGRPHTADASFVIDTATAPDDVSSIDVPTSDIAFWLTAFLEIALVGGVTCSVWYDSSPDGKTWFPVFKVGDFTDASNSVLVPVYPVSPNALGMLGRLRVTNFAATGAGTSVSIYAFLVGN